MFLKIAYLNITSIEGNQKYHIKITHCKKREQYTTKLKVDHNGFSFFWFPTGQ